MSLPTELVSDAQKEVWRLQELRRYIQEECDQLLLKKDRLKEKVGDNPWHVEQSSRSLDAYLCLGEGILRDFPVTQSVWDMADNNETLPHFSSDEAYKVVDIIWFFLFLQKLIFIFHVGCRDSTSTYFIKVNDIKFLELHCFLDYLRLYFIFFIICSACFNSMKNKIFILFSRWFWMT